MGNYHLYEAKCHTKNIVIPDVAFFDEYAVHALIYHEWAERKHWDKFDVDMKLLSLHNPYILIIIKETWGGYHHQPRIGFYHGTLEDAIKKAIESYLWFTWGAGGSVECVDVMK